MTSEWTPRKVNASMITPKPRNAKEQIPNVQTENLVAAARKRTGPKGLGRITARGWYRYPIQCPVHDDRRPSCSVKADGSLYCHTCDKYWSKFEAARLLGVTVANSDSLWNRQERRRAASRGRRIAMRERHKLETRAQRELPKHLRPLYMLVVRMAVRFGTCALSQGNMALELEQCRETVNRGLRQLRALGFTTRAGYYVIGFNPALHNHGLEMRVCIEIPTFESEALDTPAESHSMRQNYHSWLGNLPKVVTLTGWTAAIRYHEY